MPCESNSFLMSALDETCVVTGASCPVRAPAFDPMTAAAANVPRNSVPHLTIISYSPSRTARLLLGHLHHFESISKGKRRNLTRTRDKPVRLGGGFLVDREAARLRNDPLGRDEHVLEPVCLILPERAICRTT